MNWIGRLLRPLRPGVDALTSSRLGRKVAGGISVTSPVFKESEAIPRLCTVDGDGRFPGIEWTGLPAGTKEIVLLVEDADIPFAVPVTHLIVHSIDPGLAGIETGAVKPFMAEASSAGWHAGATSWGRPVGRRPRRHRVTGRTATPFRSSPSMLKRAFVFRPGVAG